jgi:hypothetical protein
MLARTPELQARLDDVLGKMALVEKGSEATARLGELTTELDAQVSRVGARLQFVEKLEARVNGLHAVTSDVEQKLAAQLARRAEMESLQNLCDTLATQVADAQQKLDGVTALQGRVLPLASQVDLAADARTGAAAGRRDPHRRSGGARTGATASFVEQAKPWRRDPGDSPSARRQRRPRPCRFAEAEFWPSSRCRQPSWCRVADRCGRADQRAETLG